MKLRLIMLFSVLILLSGCATTKVLNISTGEGEPRKLTKVFVVGVIKEEAYRRIFEQKVAAELRRDGVEAVTSFDLFKTTDKIDKAEAEALFKEHGADGVVLFTLVDKERLAVDTPGTPVGVTMVTVTSYSSGWYGYYSGYQVYASSGRTYDYLELTAETVIYDLDSDKRVWSALTRTTELKRFEAIESYIKGIRKPLRESGLF